jgi:hypothetical protein
VGKIRAAAAATPLAYTFALGQQNRLLAAGLTKMRLNQRILTSFRCWAIALLLSASLFAGEPSFSAKDQYRSLASAMRKARESNDWPTYLADAAKLQTLLNSSPNTWLNLARGEMHAGHVDKALVAVGTYAAMGQSAGKLFDVPEFAPLRQSPKFAAIQKQMTANDSEVSHGTAVFDIEPGFVAEDIDYDPQSKHFFVTCIQKKKIIAVDSAGKTTDFASAPDSWPMMAIKIDAQRRLLWATEVALDGYVLAPKSDWGKSVVLCYSLADGKLLLRIDGPQGSALGDMVLLDNGDPLLSDGTGGGVYRLRQNAKLLERVDDGSFISPQTPALAPDGKHVFVPDYLRGIGVLDLTSGKVQWLAMQEKYALNGTDGLYFSKGQLIATQNGTSPERVIVFKLDPSLSRIVSNDEIQRAGELGDPTHGVIVGSDFYYIANSGWDTLNDDGSVKPDAKPTPAHIMRAPLH